MGVGVPEMEAVVEADTKVTVVDGAMDVGGFELEVVAADVVAAEVEATVELAGTLDDEDGTEEDAGGGDEDVGSLEVVVVDVGGGGAEVVDSVVVVLLEAAVVDVLGSTMGN